MSDPLLAAIGLLGLLLVGVTALILGFVQASRDIDAHMARFNRAHNAHKEDKQ